ncbi:hypothetical protein ACAX43_26620 [Paraburkholderia sp. IW21]|uniref:hypothetical protein n=1 Tax=Paraburkholderia sp. IW21 TaxID=3242488 RepID=UPI0035209926
MPLDTTISYGDLTGKAESVIRDFLSHGDSGYAFGAYFLWTSVAFQAALNIGRAAVSEYEADKIRLKALLDETRQG